MKTNNPYPFSAEYLAGWHARYNEWKLKFARNPFTNGSDQWRAFSDGYHDCEQGKIDGVKALGPDLEVSEK